MESNINKFADLSMFDEKKVDEKVKQLDIDLMKNKGMEGQKKPPGWSTLYEEGELIEIKGYWFKVKHIMKDRLILRPWGATKEGHKSVRE